MKSRSALSFVFVTVPVLFLTLMAVVTVFILMRVAFPERMHSELTPSSLLMNCQQIELRTTDNIKLLGYYVPGKGPSIILCHDAGANLGDLLPLASMLNQTGYSVLLFDFRRHGRSAGWISTMGAREQLDVLAAVTFLKSRGLRGKIGLVGISMGGYAGALAAAKADELASLILVDPYPNRRILFRDRIEEQFKISKGPLSHIIGWVFALCTRTTGRRWDLDEVLPTLHNKSILFISSQTTPQTDTYCHNLYNRTPEPKELAIIKDFNRTLLLGSDKAALEQRITRFFKYFLPAEQHQGRVVSAGGTNR